MVLVSVKVNTPDEALGMETAPVEAVIKPELESVVLTVKPLDPAARVPAVTVSVLLTVVVAGKLNVVPELLSVRFW